MFSKNFLKSLNNQSEENQKRIMDEIGPLIKYMCANCEKFTCDDDEWRDFVICQNGDCGLELCIECWKEDKTKLFVCPNNMSEDYCCNNSVCIKEAKKMSLEIKNCEECGLEGCYAPNESVCIELCKGCNKYKCYKCRLPFMTDILCGKCKNISIVSRKNNKPHKN